MLLFCSCCALAQSFINCFADRLQRGFSIFSIGGKAQVMPFFTPSATTFIRLRPLAGLPLPSVLVTVMSLLKL